MDKGTYGRKRANFCPCFVIIFLHIFDFCYLKDHVDMSRLASCIKAYIIDEPSMREKDMNGVRKRVALIFSNRQFRRNVEHSGDRNWLQIDVGVAFKMIQEFLETVNL